MPPVPAERVRVLNGAPPAPRGDYVLYWMTAARRTTWNFALERAVSAAREHGRPLLILEAVRADHPHASDRLHAFLLQGMAANRARLAGGPAAYHPYVEPAPGAGAGLLAALAGRAVLVVTDWFPAFAPPGRLAAAARQVPVRLEAVDGIGLWPLFREAGPFPGAYAFRRRLQRELAGFLGQRPAEDPLAGARLPALAELPAGLAVRWPAAGEALLAARPEALAILPLDHGVPPASAEGGSPAGEAALARFLAGGLAAYAARRHQPEPGATSGLSPYLHFGHLAAHRVFWAVAGVAGFAAHRLGPPTGRREGFWGLDAGPEAFLDQLVTWRELCQVHCHRRPDHAAYGALPAWARATLEAHRGDRRPWLYRREELLAAATHDPVWNAAQRQLLAEGTITGYLRMLWGKKILEWSATPEEALATMLQLNDHYALDGRDANSIGGVFWCLGLFDRPFRERPVTGKLRILSSERTRRKLALGAYLARHAPGAEGGRSAGGSA